MKRFKHKGLFMKTITIQIPDNCEIQIVRKEEEKECKFKKGDIIVSGYGSIAIFVNKVGCGIG